MSTTEHERHSTIRSHPIFESEGVSGSLGRDAEGRATLAGYPARDLEEGVWRIYPVHWLQSAYWRVQESDILSSRELATDREPARRTTVWLKADATVEFVQGISIQARTLPAQAAAFLEGSITTSGKEAAPAVTASGGAQPEGTPFGVAILSIMTCPAAAAAAYAWYKGAFD